MADTELANDLLEDISEVLEELGNPISLIKRKKKEVEESNDYTEDDTQTDSYETVGVVYVQKDFYGNVLSASGERKIVIDLKRLNGVLPEIEDIVADEDVLYKIIDIEYNKVAGIKVSATLTGVA